LALAAGLAVLPGEAVNAKVFCSVSSVIPVLGAVKRRMTEVPMFRPTPSEAELLTETVTLARGLADPRLRTKASLDAFSLEVDRQGERSSQPILTPSERRELERWNAICGSRLPPRQAGLSPGRFIGVTWRLSAAHQEGSEGGEGMHEQLAVADGSHSSDLTGVVAQSRRPAGHYSVAVETASLGLVAILVSLVLAVHLSAKEASRSQKYPCNASSFVRIGAQTASGIFVDVSQRGGKLRVDGPLPVRAKCSVWIDGTWVEARVVWSNRHYAGVDFLKALRLSVVHSLVRDDRKRPV
jgi:hypothetical protein